MSLITDISDDNLALLETGHGNYLTFLKIPRFGLDMINLSWGTQPFPAFVVNGTVVDHIYISQFLSPHHGRVDPEQNMSFLEARARCRSLGSGFHLMTAWEYAALIWFYREEWEKTRGVFSDQPAKNGEGPISYRFPAKWWGAYGLWGNLYEFVDGIQVRDKNVYGTLQNNHSLHNTADSADISKWPLITTLPEGYSNTELQDVPSTNVILKQLLLAGTNDELTPKGQAFYIPFADGDTRPIVLERGGAFHSGLEAGFAAYRFRVTENQNQYDSGFRVAYTGA
jgi:hypothetical protein